MKYIGRLIWRLIVLLLTFISSQYLQGKTEAANSNYQLTQPQIFVQDGHIHLIPGENKNLVLEANGEGKILLNNFQLDNLVESIQSSSRELATFKSIFGTPSTTSSQISTRLTSIEDTVARLNQLDSFNTRLITVEQRVAANNGSSSNGSRTINNRIRRLRTRVEAIEAQLNGVGTANRNPCTSNPCLNGGSCIPTIYGPFCLCLKGWEGDRCNLDVNECANNLGTEFACQNGGTCLNTLGSYRCICRSGYDGISCSKRAGDCSSGSNRDKCDHGTCVNQHNGQHAFTCICEPGWTKDGSSPTCSVDIDECSQFHTSCSSNPPVQCINTPGSFVCGSCPPGYSGNGHRCNDINECLVHNGGCSMNPIVQCINTVGSRECGPCPAGYIGNGVSCQYVGLCNVNNGGCHQLARCTSFPGMMIPQCSCPNGYLGSGYGQDGCYAGSGTAIGPAITPGGNPCVPNPCLNNGVCHAFSNGFTCTCQFGFGGPTCGSSLNPCDSQPCQNGGTCNPTPSGVSCTCVTGYAGDLCERQSESCGGYFSETAGVIRYPQITARYSHHASCEWLLRTTPGAVLNITFTQFHLEGGRGCTFDFLEIRDGSDTASQLLGRYCGDELPNGGNNLLSTHNAAHITFRSDHSVDGLGFELSWNTSSPICGGILENGTYGTLRSPGYPGNYPHNRDCIWKIKVALGKRIQLVFATFEMETHPNCSYDYLEVRDGYEDAAPILEKLCNSTAPQPVTSSGPYLTVRFHTDESSSAQGFLATYTQVPGVPGCGGLLTVETGVFSSPHHPQPYAHGLECDWLIRLPSREDKISLKFLTFDLEQSFGRECYFDYVDVHDGSSIESPLVGRFCGTNVPLLPFYKSTGNQIFVKFKSDESIARGGFSAKYETVCGGEFMTLEGTLRSPFYPSNYPHNRDCIYIINQPSGRGITLQFLDFRLEGISSGRCFYDYVEIRDGDTANATRIGRYCGENTPGIITSTFNYLWIRFKTDGNIDNKGFLANYTTFETGCGGILRNSNGTISSPGHPEIYPHGVSCIWVIRGNPGEIVRLTWDVFNVEQSYNCRWDAVEIYDNSTDFVNGSLVGKYCGQELPPTITSTDTTLTIIFRSDHSAAYDGFMASYKLVNATTLCGGNFFTTNGVIKSPRYPDPYPNSKTCTWVITAPRGRQIQLNVTDFVVENATSSGCLYDFLEIRNGHLPMSPLIGKFCGRFPPPSNIPSFSNSIYLKFKTDSSHRAKGFRILWDATATGCGGTLAGPSGTITSPNYPGLYHVGLDCEWKIKANQGSTVFLTFVDMNFGDQTVQCPADRIEVFDGIRRNGALLGKFCSLDGPHSLQTNSTAVTIKLRSFYFTGGGSFKVNYRSVCNRVISGGLHGVIESPNYPNPYPHNRNCTWIVEATKGNKLNVSFSHFDIEGPYLGNCSYDFVQISNWKRKHPDNKTVLGTFCGANRPSLISSTGDSVAISFVSDYSHALNGFRLEWIQYGCGGYIDGNWGYISSPDYPRRYAHDVECIWIVTGQPGTKIKLTIYELDVEHSQLCEWDGLVVHAGRDESSPRLSKICQTISSGHPTSIESHGNHMYLRFYSDDIVAAKGFYGYTEEVAGGCGGAYSGTSGYIYSPNYPANYDHNDDCSWLITVDNTHVVELKFEEFVIERHINCSYDRVEIYDGASIYDPVLLTHCGNELPSPVTIRATGSSMLVRLVTDESTTGKGFKAMYSQGCGARLTSYSGAIATPNYPHQYTGVLNCTWIIASESPDDRITVQFTHMESIPGDGSCTYANLQFFDGEDEQAAQLYQSCGSASLPPAITSSGNTLFLHYFTSYATLKFRAVYTMSASACGGDIISTNGSIISPNFPSGYPPNAECIWTISVGVGNKLQLGFRRFELDTSDYCNQDFLEIHERSSEGRLLGHYCGTDMPTNVTAYESLWILFRTDDQGQAPGFFADFNLLNDAELSGSWGQIYSPLYPMTYAGDGRYTWRITVNESRAIEIGFYHFDMDYQDCRGSLKIYDGIDSNSAELATMCGRTTPEPLTSTGNVVFIVFNKIDRFSGFSLYWNQVQLTSSSLTRTNISGCGGNFSVPADNGTVLTSPGFPFPYEPNLNCVWNFDAPPNSKLRITVNSMSLESHGACLYDRVEIYDGDRGLPNYRLNKTLCLYTEVNNSYVTSGRFVRIVFSTDRYRQNYGFKMTLTTECGGYVRESRGVISSPGFPTTYLASSCTWQIAVKPARTIRITFNSSFEIYSAGGQCLIDHLVLRNGASNDSPFLGAGRFCGTTAPAALETSGNNLFVEFTSWTHGGKGFSFLYEETWEGCGGTIHLTNNAPNTIISSPNYPQPPVPFTECEWVITVPQEESVQLTFIDSFVFTIDWNGCQIEGIEIRNGGTQISPLVDKYCNTKPGTVTSTGNALYIRYYTTIAEPRAEFKAEIKIATCGGLHISPYWWNAPKFITSPNFPANYPTNTNCTWTLQSQSDYSVEISVEYLNFGMNDNCTTDYIIVKEASSHPFFSHQDTPARVWRLCSNSSENETTTINSAWDQLLVTFVSDSRPETGSGYGFKIKYTSSWQECYHPMTTPTGIIETTNYPQPFILNRCTWTITAPPGRRIRLEFLDFQLSPKTLSDGKLRCNDNQLFLYQSPSYVQSIYGRFYNSNSLCGSTLPPPVESTAGFISIYYSGWTDRLRGNTKLKIRYSTDLPLGCGGTLPPFQGNISSPIKELATGTPDTTTSVVCQWQIEEGAPNGTVAVTVHQVTLPGKSNDTVCYDQFLTIGQGTDYSTNRICSSTTNRNIYISGESLRVDFVAATWNSSFSLSYQTFPCGGKLASEGNISSLNYPAQYPVNTHCVWEIITEWATRLKIHFFELDLDEHQDSSGCDYDYVLIRNGNHQKSPVMGKFCGSSLPQDVISMSHTILIEFHSDSRPDEGRRGFVLGVQKVEHGCGGIIHNAFGRIGSPNEPSTTNSKYPPNTECEWTIETRQGYSLGVLFTGRFDLEMSVNCSNDYVEVFKPSKFDWISLGRFCGRQTPAMINTTSSSLKIKFKSNENANGDGFQLQWVSYCGGVYNEPSGVIRSAYYDGMYYSTHHSGEFMSWDYYWSDYNHKKCEYIVNATQQEYVMLQFVEPFDVKKPHYWWDYNEQANSQCMDTNVTISGLNATTPSWPPVLGPYCGQNLPPTYIRRGAAVINYWYNGDYSNHGFRVKYSKAECGGIVTSPRIIKSPGNPYTSAANMNCTWVVTSPTQKVVRFKFKFLELEYSSRCHFDAVRLYDGPLVDSSKLIGNYCGNLTNELATMSSKTNSMTVVFITDYSVQHGGFESAVDFTVGPAQGCGGIINVTNPVTLTSVDTNNDGKYEHDLNCQWIIIAPEFSSIQLSFTTFALEGADGTVGKNGSFQGSCPFDYLEIRDGSTPGAQRLQKICGSSPPSRVYSSGNALWIQFVTDGAINFAGFSLTVSHRPSPCGPLVLNATTTTQYIQSPQYPLNYPASIRCRWRIDAMRSYDEVDVTFEDIDIESSPNCDKDRLEIRDLSYTTPEGISDSVLFTGSPRTEWRHRHLNVTSQSLFQDIQYCGSDTPPDFFSLGRSIELVFVSDDTVFKKGFKLAYKTAGCNRTFERTQGRIFSPSFPARVNQISNCLSSIRAPNNSFVSLYFNTFGMPNAPGQSECVDNGLEFRDGTPTGPVLASYCGESIPDPVFSNTSTVYVRFFTRRRYEIQGYDITYTTTDMGRGCGGDIFHTGGSFTSPMYPGNYSKNMDCRWKVRVPGSLRVQIQFTNFAFNGNCNDDFVEILSAESHNPTAAPVLFSKYCSGDLPAVYTSTTDMAIVRYKTSVNNSGAGWRAMFKGVQATEVPTASLPSN